MEYLLRGTQLENFRSRCFNVVRFWSLWHGYGHQEARTHSLATNMLVIVCSSGSNFQPMFPIKQLTANINKCLQDPTIMKVNKTMSHFIILLKNSDLIIKQLFEYKFIKLFSILQSPSNSAQITMKVPFTNDMILLLLYVVLSYCKLIPYGLI